MITSDLSTFAPIDLIIRWEAEYFICRIEGVGNRDKSVSKPILLGLTTAIIIGVLTPLVIPHISHPSMIYHIILHLAGLTIASFLGLVSYLCIQKSWRKQDTFNDCRFHGTGTAEILYFLDAMDIFPMVHLPIANISCLT